MRRYQLQDYWESDMWNATSIMDTLPPVAETEAMGLWRLGNSIISGEQAAKRHWVHLVVVVAVCCAASNSLWELPCSISWHHQGRCCDESMRFWSRTAVSCDTSAAASAAAAREVNSNHERMVANGTGLSQNRFWRFVLDNAPWALYSGYKLTLFGLVSSCCLSSYSAVPHGNAAHLPSLIDVHNVSCT